MTEHYYLFFLCLAVASCVNFVTHRSRGIKRGTYGVIVIGLISGFASFMMTLILSMPIPLHWALLGAGISAFYSWFMADAKTFEKIGR